MAKVRIVGLQENGCYTAHEVAPQKTAEILERLKQDPAITAIQSRLILSPVFKLFNASGI